LGLFTFTLLIWVEFLGMCSVFVDDLIYGKFEMGFVLCKI